MKKTDEEIIAKKNHDALVAKYGLAYWNSKTYRDTLIKQSQGKLK